MAKDPAFLFYPGDYLRDTQCLSESVQVAYDRIMCEHMRNICVSRQQLNFFTKKLSPGEKEELLAVLTKVDGGFQIDWVVDSVTKRRAYSESRSKNREGKGPKKPKEHMKTYVSHMEDENEDENKDDYIKKDKECFELFWELYGKKVGREKAIKSWSKLSEDEKGMALHHVTMYVKSTPEVKYRKDPTTYLNQKAFNDEIINNGQSKQPSAIRGLAGFTSNTESLKSDLAQLHNGGAAGFNPEIPF